LVAGNEHWEGTSVTNIRPELLLPDNAPVRCTFEVQDDAPLFWLECKTNATEELQGGELVRWRQWLDEHPRAIIGTRSGNVYLCDKHQRIIRDNL
jgi:hypothetical protein